jgi:hypothetical protein
MQHFRVKFFARQGLAPADLGIAIPVFHAWIQQRVFAQLWIDVADYRHVPNGPGVVLMGHDGMFALDQAKGRLGLLYTRRTAMDSSLEERIRQAITAAARACSLLQSDAAFASLLNFDASRFELSANDRLLAPNSEDSYSQLRPPLASVLDAAWGPASYRLERGGQPRELLTITAVRDAPADFSCWG